MMNPQTAVRLHQTIAALTPIHGVRVGTAGSSATCEIKFKPEATGPQQAAAQNALDTFDWSDAATAAWANLQSRTDASALMNTVKAEGKVLRALVLVLIDEINALRQWVAAFKAATAAATNLANLQTRVAGLPNMPDRTLAQAKTAIANTLDAGTVD